MNPFSKEFDLICKEVHHLVKPISTSKQVYSGEGFTTIVRLHGKVVTRQLRRGSHEGASMQGKDKEKYTFWGTSGGGAETNGVFKALGVTPHERI